MRRRGSTWSNCLPGSRLRRLDQGQNLSRWGATSPGRRTPPCSGRPAVPGYQPLQRLLRAVNLDQQRPPASRHNRTAHPQRLHLSDPQQAGRRRRTSPPHHCTCAPAADPPAGAPSPIRTPPAAAPPGSARWRGFRWRPAISRPTQPTETPFEDHLKPDQLSVRACARGVEVMSRSVASRQSARGRVKPGRNLSSMSWTNTPALSAWNGGRAAGVAPVGERRM